MHISKVELENIKSHIDSKFEFTPGTIAITGENGAGKTTIIEAVAWTLFDVLDYKKDDFARRGAKKGCVRVTFESGLDEREYLVYRDTGTGYYVFDPRIGKRIAERREEVTRFLWQHLGLEPGTDLRSLFKEAVGVPQGTLTAIFLGTPVERKATFDRLLKVEEYRQAAEKLRETTRFVENAISAVTVNIARAEGELARADAAEAELKIVEGQISSMIAEAESLSAENASISAVVAEFDRQEKAMVQLRAELERARSELQRARLLCGQREAEFRQSAEAAEKVALVHESADRHVALLGRLSELDRERYEREKLRGQLGKIETALASVEAEHKRLRQALESSQKAHSEITLLIPMAAEQERLEQAAAELRSQIATLNARVEQIKLLDTRLARLRKSYRSTLDQIRAAESHEEAARSLSELERRDAELIRRVAELRAGLERDQQFQREIKNGLCPVLSEKCLNLKNGQTLDGFVREQFAGLKSEIETLEAEHATVGRGLAAARSAREKIAAIETLRARERELAGEGKSMAEEKAVLEKQATDLAGLAEDLRTLELQIRSLDDPKTKKKVLENEAAREDELRRELSNVESNLERLGSDRSITLMQLESYKDVDAEWASAVAERDSTAEAYQVYLANKDAAGFLEDRRSLFDAARTATGEFERSLAEATAKLTAADDRYDVDKHARERENLRRSDGRLSEVRATLDIARRRERELGVELKRLDEMRSALAAEFAEKARLSKVLETAAFIRETLREAAPRVARNYVHHVSVEAAQMFREICGRSEQTLCWSEDYGITLEDEGFGRPFGNLSGGEQMAAALSVRLAILKQLSDIRIAFFDEPTANMDAERRENLAQQISQIRNFDQLFVISHDDTFEGHVDQILRIGSR